MRLRKNIRTPVRFEDEAVSFDIPKKRQHTTPAFPEKMAQQVVQFNRDATPAAFPSLPLNSAVPSHLLANTALAVTEPAVNIGDSAGTNQHELPCIGEETDTTWSSLELAIQHRIWINLRQQHSEEHAATLLQLSEGEVHNIRLAIEKRRQCPIDSTRVLASLDAVDDCDGHLLAQFTPYILIAQSYELAFPCEVERGKRYLRKLQLEDPEWNVGAWLPDPEGSSYLKCVPDVQVNTPTENSAPSGHSYLPSTDNDYAEQAGVGSVPGTDPVSDSLQYKANTYLSDIEYRESMQANAARLRLLRANDTLEAQFITRKHFGQTHDAPAISKETVQTAKMKLEPKTTRRLVVIKAGSDPEEPPSTIVVAPPSISPITPVHNEPQSAPLYVGPVNQMTAQVSPQSLESMSKDAMPVGDRSSGSMSLRSRNRLRESQAMVSMKQNHDFWEGRLDEVPSSESEEDSAAQPRTPAQKVISIRIDDKNALATIFRGGQKIQASYPERESNVFSNKFPNLRKPTDNNSITETVSRIADEPDLFARHMCWSIFPEAERQLLLSKPIEARNNIEMWLIYGTNAWKPESPWNAGRVVPMFKQPALGASLNPDQARSDLGRTLVAEWNRYQSHDIGQKLFEETTVGSIIFIYYAKMVDIKQTWQNLVRDEQILEASGHVSCDQDRIDPHRRYHEEVQHLTRQVRLDLTAEYAKRFQKLGKAIPSMGLSTPSIAQVNSGRDGQSLRQDRSLVSVSTALRKTPEQLSRKASSNDFATKLIETPSTGAAGATTPQEDSFGIFGTDDDLSSGLQHAHLTMENLAPGTPSRSSDSRYLPVQKDSSPLNKHRIESQRVSEVGGQYYIGNTNQSAEAENVVMVDAPPEGKAAAVAESAVVASTLVKQKQSPRRPSWSPISDSEEFHLAPNTPVLSHDQHSEASTPRVVYTPGRLTLLLSAAVSKATAKINEAGEPIPDAPGIRDVMKLPAKADLLEPAHLVESIMPSIESNHSAQQHKQAGKARNTPKLKLSLKQPLSLSSAALVPPKNSLTLNKEQSPNKTSAPASKDATPASEASSMVTRSMTATPAPGEMLPSTTISTKKRKTTTAESKATKKTIKTHVAAPAHAQIDAIKREEAKDALASGGNTSTAVTPNSPGQTTGPRKSTPATSTTPRRPRGPYKKTREKMERLQAEKEARKSAGEDTIANADTGPLG